MNYGETAQQVLEALQAAAGDDGDASVVITRTTPTPRGSSDAATTATTNGVGLVFEYNRVNSGDGVHPGTEILAGDKQLLLAALDANGVAITLPKKGDKCLAPDGITYNVENVKPLAPSGVAVLYDVNLRK